MNGQFFAGMLVGSWIGAMVTIFVMALAVAAGRNRIDYTDNEQEDTKQHE